ncbi:MAG TPA: LamG-like jellyroll fold domain-containing protein [Puia sp.]|nr:LamG-like jellyroll fold domain-containing protein [Puia sp.]
MRKTFTFLLTILCLSPALSVLAQNSALQFTGTNYVSAGIDAVDPSGGEFTIECWVYVPDTMNDGNIHQFVSEGSDGLAFYLGYGADGTIVGGDAWGATPSTGIPMPLGTWTHIAMTFDGLTAILYVDGDSVAGSVGYFFTDGSPLTLGAYVDGSQRFVGRMDEMKVWSVARSRAQIRGDLFGIPDAGDNTLVAYFEMNDGSGTLVSNAAPTGSSQNGQIINDLGGANSWTASPVQFGNNALVFDGVDDQVVIPANSDYDLTGGGTVEFWVNPTTLSGTFATILGNRGPGGVRYSFHLSSTQIGLDNGTTVNTLDYAVPTNTWTHLAFVTDGSASTTVYVNGTAQGTITGALGSAPAGQPLTLGIAKNTSGPDDRPFAGGIDEVRIWNTQRSAASILGNANNTLTGTEAGLVAQFSFNMGTTAGNNDSLTTALDNSAAGNHGRISNFALSGTGSNFTAHTLAIIPLPVILSSFTATRLGTESLLQWKTEQEENTRDFTVERSTDDKTFTPIGIVAAAGNSNSSRAYSFIDVSPGQYNNYYRLRQSDIDGKFTYTAIRVVSFPSPNRLIWYIIGRQAVEISLQKGNSEPYALSDVTGRLLRLGQLSDGKTDLSGLPAGLYIVRVMTSGGPLAVEVPVY